MVGVRALVITALAVVASIAAMAAPAKAAGPGPGLFSSIRLTDKGLLFTVASDGTPFVAPVRVEIADAIEFVRVPGRSSVRKSGGQLLHRGDFAGLIPDNEQRRLRVRNGDGATTEVDVLRLGDGFLVTRVLQTPSKPVRTGRQAVRSGVDLRTDTAVDLAVEQGSAVYDVTVAFRIPSLPDGVRDVITRTVARDSEGRVYPGIGSFSGTSLTRFHHVLLPEGIYTFSIVQTAVLGNPLVATVSVERESVRTEPFSVSRRDRAVEVPVAAVEIPAFAPASVSLEGLDAFGPTFSNRIDVAVELESVDGQVSISATRDVGSAGPLVIEAPVPSGEYSAGVSIRGGDRSPNGAAFSFFLTLGARRIDPAAAFSLPQVVRVSGTVLDPELVLAGSSGPRTPFHYVGVSGTTADGNRFTSFGELRGFARGYALFVPRGATGGTGVTLELASDDPVARATLALVPSTEPDVFDTDRDDDVVVPALPGFVMVRGTVRDADGRVVPYAAVSLYGPVTGVNGATFGTVTLAGRDGAYAVPVQRGSAYTITAFALFE